jgi:hypothetical protein
MDPFVPFFTIWSSSGLILSRMQFNKTLANQFTQANAIGLLSAGVAVNIAYTNAQRNASGEAPISIPQSYKVPIPTGNQNPSRMRRRDDVKPPRQKLF